MIWVRIDLRCFPCFLPNFNTILLIPPCALSNGRSRRTYWSDTVVFNNTATKKKCVVPHLFLVRVGPGGWLLICFIARNSSLCDARDVPPIAPRYLAPDQRKQGPQPSTCLRCGSRVKGRECQVQGGMPPQRFLPCLWWPSRRLRCLTPVGMVANCKHGWPGMGDYSLGIPDTCHLPHYSTHGK